MRHGGIIGRLILKSRSAQESSARIYRFSPEAEVDESGEDNSALK